MREAKRRIHTGALVFALVLLANPNFNVVDIFPDFIAWLILARLFSAPADRILRKRARPL